MGGAKCLCNNCFSHISYTDLRSDDFLKVSKKDNEGLPERYKLIGQFVTAGLAFYFLGPLSNTLTGFDSNAVHSNLEMREIWFPFYSYDSPEDVMKLPVIAVFILFLITMTGSSNAINLTDGLDGLAIGCTVTVALTYAVMAYASGNFLISEYLKISWVPGTGELTVVCTALLGGSLAFLWFNAHPAETWGIPVPGNRWISWGHCANDSSTFTLIIVGGIFVMEAGSVILQVASFKTRARGISNVTDSSSF